MPMARQQHPWVLHEILIQRLCERSAVKSVVVRDLFNLVGVPSQSVDLSAKPRPRKSGKGTGAKTAAPEAGVAEAELEAEAELARLAVGGNGFRPLPVD